MAMAQKHGAKGTAKFVIFIFSNFSIDNCIDLSILGLNHFEPHPHVNRTCSVCVYLCFQAFKRVYRIKECQRYV